jgi:hypothetical protein
MRLVVTFVLVQWFFGRRAIVERTIGNIDLLAQRHFYKERYEGNLNAERTNLPWPFGMRNFWRFHATTALNLCIFRSCANSWPRFRSSINRTGSRVKGSAERGSGREKKRKGRGMALVLVTLLRC